MNSLATIPAPSALAPRPSEIYASGCTLDEMHAAHKARQWRMGMMTVVKPVYIPPPKVRSLTLKERACVIAGRIARQHGTTYETLRSASMDRSVARARHHAMFAIWQETGASRGVIAEALNRDFTSVIYGVRKHCWRVGLTPPEEICHPEMKTPTADVQR